MALVNYREAKEAELLVSCKYCEFIVWDVAEGEDLNNGVWRCVASNPLGSAPEVSYFHDYCGKFLGVKSVLVDVTAERKASAAKEAKEAFPDFDMPGED